MITSLLKNNWLVITGVLVGLIVGYLYYQEIGCLSGTCMITSDPMNSSAYGALMGGLVFSMFKKKKSQNEKN